MSVPKIHQLVELFFPSVDQLGELQLIPADEMPEPYRHLLDHDHHMTVVVEQHYAEPVDVQVLELHQSPTHYWRKIVLTRRSDQHVVQFGIVRLRMDALPNSVADLIRTASIPLGRILIENDVMRKVTRTELWRIRPRNELATLFQCQGSHDQDACVTYGRTAMIHVDGVPTVELLEILAPIT
jgi:chorismate-pyruvate lyase